LVRRHVFFSLAAGNDRSIADLSGANALATGCIGKLPATSIIEVAAFASLTG
jgi:hypothetical protein